MVIATPNPPVKQEIAITAPQMPVHEIVNRIAILETSNSKNDKCVREGLGFNPYGYGQQLNKYTCFDSKDRVKKIVENWFTEKLKTMSLEQAVCGYNQGFKKQLKDCTYLQNFKSL